MNLKKGVIVGDIKPAIWYAIGIAEIIWRDLGRSLVVTSLRDGEHITDSLHYKGLAADFRTRDMTDAEKSKAFLRLKLTLDDMGYDVILEKDHAHVEFDPQQQDNPWQTYVE